MNKLNACALHGVDVGGAPDEIKLLPLGVVHSQKGDFLVDEESCRMILQHFKNRQLDLVIDYEHQTLDNVQAPAAGWVKKLRVGEDAIMAKVEWTPKAREYLKNKEYRYLSPVVLKRETDDRVTYIHSGALTNTPAINGMFPIVNSLDIEDYDEDSEGGKNMELEKLIKLLGLEEGASEEDIVKAIESLMTDAAKLKEGTEVVANSTILSLLGLQDTAKTEDVTATIMSLKSSGNDEQVLELKRRLDKKEADEAVQEAMKAGKIASAQREWAIGYALKDPAGFKAFVEKAPATVPIGKVKSIDASDGKEPTMDALVLKNLGLTDEEIKKYAQKEEV